MKWLSAGNSLINGNLVADTIHIGGNRVPVSLLDDDELRKHATTTNAASNKRAARLYFAAGAFLMEAQVTGKICHALLGDDAPLINRLTIFGLLFGLLATVTYAQMSNWLRRNWTVMKRHRRDHAVAVAELDMRRAPLSEGKLSNPIAEFRRRALLFFYE